MAIRLDKTDDTVLAHCTICSWWELRDDSRRALEAGAAHERAAHPGTRTTYHRLYQATRRGQADFR